MADNRLKLTAGLLKMPEAQRQELARMGENYKRLQEADYLRKMGEQGVGLAKSVARGVPQMATGLVDLAAMPFEYAGVIQPGQAVGSTKWLESKGYLPEQQEGFINQTAELLSGGFDPSDLITKGLPALGMIGKTVWHGSPHTFDKFDLSKIGTGEGAQAYGHGLYFAESPGVATSYKEGLTNKARPSNISTGYENAAWIQARNAPDMPTEQLIPYVKQAYPDIPDAEIAAAIEKSKGSLQQGSLYKVDLPDEHIAKMLDWDKPFSEQPQNVQDAITKYWKENRVYGDPTKLTGEGIYGSIQGHVLGNRGSDIANRSASQEAASMDLNYMGVPGIQYLDQASRGVGEGTRNYVVFSDEIPQILERNGQPVAQALRDYRGAHTAPGPEFGAQLHDLTGGGQMYPDDVYSPNAYRFYGHGGPDVALDKETTKIAQSFRGKPDEMVDIYRAVPNETDITAINAGDWVTINPNYAKQHGESQLGGDYKILQQKVPAKTIWTNADSIHEYGYWPE